MREHHPKNYQWAYIWELMHVEYDCDIHIGLNNFPHTTLLLPYGIAQRKDFTSTTLKASLVTSNHSFIYLPLNLKKTKNMIILLFLLLLSHYCHIDWFRGIGPGLDLVNHCHLASHSHLFIYGPPSSMSLNKLACSWSSFRCTLNLPRTIFNFSSSQAFSFFWFFCLTVLCEAIDEGATQRLAVTFCNNIARHFMQTVINVQHIVSTEHRTDRSRIGTSPMHKVNIYEHPEIASQSFTSLVL